MRKNRTFAAALALLLLVALTWSPARADEDPVALVDPMIGTFGAGFVFPGPAAPYGMVQLSPDTDGYFAYTGYQWSDTRIRGFSHVHVQSMGVPEGGNVPFMPITGEVRTDAREYASRFSHADEHAEVGYYRVGLPDHGVEAELTAGLRIGMHRYTFPDGGGHVLIDAGRQIPGGDLEPPLTRAPGSYPATVAILPDQRTVVGTANHALAKPHRYAVHFAARFDRRFDGYGTWATRGAAPSEGTTHVDGDGAGAYVSFDDGGVLHAKVGISFVSQENALANLEAEMPEDRFDFEELRARTRAEWRTALEAIRVEGGTPGERTSFATALYHAQHHPNVFNDVNGEYLGHDGVVHRIGAPDDLMPDGSTYYTNFSLWDTYRAEMPLLALIAPERFADMMRSMRAMAEHGAAAGLRVPRWALMNRNPDFMNGEPALQTVADGICRGLVPDDALPSLYAALRRAALDPAHHRDPSFLSPGWTFRDTSATLEHASGAFALALAADALGEDADRDALLGLAGNWGNVFDPETRFARPRAADGTWKSPYLPEDSEGFREGTGWQYTWLVPHDVAGLYTRMGAPPHAGEPLVLSRLDTFFAPAHAAPLTAGPEAQQKASLYGIAYYGNQYAPSNEHDLQAPWLYDWTSQPWKTQHLQRAYQSLYRPTPDGLPGNDDLGTLSAWFVWSALGFYPMIPGAPVYVLGSPLFERAEIALGDGEAFVVEAPGASQAVRFIRGATLNDTALERVWFTHEDLVSPGTLRFEMSAAPDPLLWSEPSARPPSQSTSSLDAFACTP